MFRSVSKFPNAAAEIARRRADLASKILFHAASEKRSLGAHLFVDAFFDRFVQAGDDGDIEQLVGWFARATAADNPVRPPRAIAAAVVPVLQEALARDELAVESMKPIAALASVARRVSPDHADGEAQPPLDEVDAAIARVLAVMEVRDPLTAEHSRAVASWCARIARRLGMNEADVLYASRSGMVHDIGKLRVPLHILRAPRTLADREWDMMRSHVDFGDQIALEEPTLAQFRPAIRFHHERMNGAGYPYGIAGDEIPFIARVVCVADAFNAMIGRRSYRAPILPSMALFELQRASGTQFDPVVVNALEGVLSRTE